MPANNPTTALIVDDHALFREGLALLLRSLSPSIETLHAANVVDASRLLQQVQVELIFLDWWLRDSIEGADALSTLLARAPSARVVVLSGERSQQIVDGAIRRGASGFIPKEIDSRELTYALQLVLRGGIYLPTFGPDRSSARRAATGSSRSVQEAFPELTPRQADVLRVALHGQTNKQIARSLGISVATVATHLMAIYSSIGVHNRTEAVFLASQRGATIA